MLIRVAKLIAGAFLLLLVLAVLILVVCQERPDAGKPKLPDVIEQVYFYFPNGKFQTTLYMNSPAFPDSIEVVMLYEGKRFVRWYRVDR